MAAKRLALCITDLEPGGAEKCLVELAVRADRTRFAPQVYSLAGPPPAGRDACAKRLASAGVPVHFLGARRLVDLPVTLSRLVRLLRAQRPDVLQTFLFHANIAGRLAARAVGIPLVFSGIRVAHHGAARRLWLERITDRMVGRHVCVSQAVADFSRTRGRLPPDKLAVIPNGIDVGSYPAPRADLGPLGIPPGQAVVTYVGRLDHQKGLDWLLDTAPRWLGVLPESCLLLVGEGPQRQALQRKAAALGIAPRVHFAGWRPDVPEILAATRLLILPSRWEGMPNAVLEAMASGLPVVASDVEGVRELLGPQAANQTVPFGDEQVLVDRVVGLLQDAALATKIAAANRRRAEEQFGVERMVEAYQALWNGALPSPSGRGVGGEGGVTV